MQKTEKKKKGLIFPVIINRIIMFLFYVCILIVFLYMIGSTQGFLDSTQLFLLRFASLLGLLLSTGSVFGLVYALIQFVKKTQRVQLLRSIIFYTLMMLAGIFLVLIVSFILAVTGGNINPHGSFLSGVVLYHRLLF